ncbi:hypothetical protein OKW39_003880 [Paraburkholderia sp. MM6662-R1]
MSRKAGAPAIHAFKDCQNLGCVNFRDGSLAKLGKRVIPETRKRFFILPAFNGLTALFHPGERNGFE